MKIAIVVVTLDVLPALRTTIDSLLRLADARVTVRVVDGASRDGTAAYLQTLAQPSVHWRSEPDRGVYDAMNKGWNAAPPAAWVLYLGAGDTVQALPSDETLASAAENGEQLVIGRCRLAQTTFVSKWDADLHFGNTVHHQALLLHRSTCGESPFDATFRVYGDWDLNLRLFCEGRRARFDVGFCTSAAPAGLSARHCLPEVWRVAFRHGGWRVGLKAYRINLRAKLLARRRGAAARAHDAAAS